MKRKSNSIYKKYFYKTDVGQCVGNEQFENEKQYRYYNDCLLYTSDAADD